jgi:hypothetical protein
MFGQWWCVHGALLMPLAQRAFAQQQVARQVGAMVQQHQCHLVVRPLTRVGADAKGVVRPARQLPAHEALGPHVQQRVGQVTPPAIGTFWWHGPPAARQGQPAALWLHQSQFTGLADAAIFGNGVNRHRAQIATQAPPRCVAPPAGLPGLHHLCAGLLQKTQNRRLADTQRTCQICALARDQAAERGYQAFAGSVKARSHRCFDWISGARCRTKVQSKQILDNHIETETGLF